MIPSYLKINVRKSLFHSCHTLATCLSPLNHLGALVNHPCSGTSEYTVDGSGGKVPAAKQREELQVRCSSQTRLTLCTEKPRRCLHWTARGLQAAAICGQPPRTLSSRGWGLCSSSALPEKHLDDLQPGQGEMSPVTWAKKQASCQSTESGARLGSLLPPPYEWAVSAAPGENGKRGEGRLRTTSFISQGVKDCLSLEKSMRE